MNTESSDLVFETHKVTLTEAYLIHDPETDSAEKIEEDEAEAEWIADYLTTDENPMEPISDYFYPIIDHGVDQINVNNEDHYDLESNKVVALLSISVYWRDAIKGILPDGTKGLHVVFENECNPSFTYQIDGSNVTFVGAGDLHQPHLSHLGISKWLHEIPNEQKQDYTGRPINQDYCPFRITIYPSDTYKSQFITNDPIRFAVVGVMIFAFTSAIFILYDCYVERRHKVINKTAVQNKMVVESLFPDFVREEVEEGLAYDSHDESGEMSTPISRLTAFLHNGTDSREFVKEPEGTVTIRKSKPIADLFPDTTVLFGK